MRTVAIIGTGIAGLGCAHFLHDRFQLTLFEKNHFIGGHANTVDVVQNGHPVSLDTGFMVFNHQTYPHLTQLLKHLGVKDLATDMSFSVRHQPHNIEWNGAGFNKLFSQRRQLFNPSFWQFLMELNRFNQTAPDILSDTAKATLTVADFVKTFGYSERFLTLYLIPMGSAIWSTSPEKMLVFPIQTLIQFFKNHGFLGLDTHFQWYTIPGGSRTYIDKLITPFRHTIQTQTSVRAVRTEDGKAVVTLENGSTAIFGRVILACHADEALALLTQPDALTQSLLAPFAYQTNWATVHTDKRVMPHRKRCWAAWNFRYDTVQENPMLSSTHYWMNRLQHLPGPTQYFVSLNADTLVDPAQVLKTIRYEHPLFSIAAIQAQQSLSQINQQDAQQALYFCGSYFKYGFHEDAFVSALNLCRILTGEALWAA